jgi:hypothetical protein
MSRKKPRAEEPSPLTFEQALDLYNRASAGESVPPEDIRRALERLDAEEEDNDPVLARVKELNRLLRGDIVSLARKDAQRRARLQEGPKARTANAEARRVIVRKLFAEGKSPSRIVSILASEHQIDVVIGTVRNDLTFIKKHPSD